MRLTIRHYFDFGEYRPGQRLAGDAGAWDALRSTSSAFGRPTTMLDVERRIADNPALRTHAQAISEIARTFGPRVVSYGVGTGLMDSLLNVAHLTLTEFTPEAVRELRQLYGANVVLHDLKRDPPLSADMHLLYRLDTEFSNRELRCILDQFQEPVLIVASNVLGVLGVARELRVRLRPRSSHAGFMRTRASWNHLWPAGFHVSEIQVGDLEAFLLTR